MVLKLFFFKYNKKKGVVSHQRYHLTITCYANSMVMAWFSLSENLSTTKGV